MKDKKIVKKIKNVIPHLKIKRVFEENMGFFSMITILPEDVFHDATEDNLHVKEHEVVIKPKKKKKFNKQILSWIFILLNVIIVATIFIKQSVDGGIKPISELFAEAPYYRFLFLGLGLMCLILLLEALKITLLSKTTTGKFRPYVSLKVAVIGRYWDCITPFGSGGQPFQIYYLSKHGYSMDNATGIPLTKHLFWTIAFAIISFVVIITPVDISNMGHLVRVLAWIGIVGNVLIFAGIMLMSLNNRLGVKIMSWIVKLLHKMRIIKDYDKAYNKMHEVFDNYQRSVKKSLKKPWHFILQVLIALTNLLLNATIAYCIYMAFTYGYILDGTATNTASWLQIICMAILCDSATSLVPLPGGSGAAELSFIGLFGALFRYDMRFWAMLFWRIFTYYGIILIGFFFTISDSVQSSRRRRRIARYEALAIQYEKEHNE